MSADHSALAMDSLLILCEKLCRSAGTTPIDTPNHTIYPGMGIPSFYRRVQIKPTPERNPQLLEDLRQLLEQPAPPPLVCCVQEQVYPELNADLAAMGLVLFRVQTGMVLSLDEFQPLPQDPHVIRISRDRLEEWAVTCKDAFDKPDELPAFELLWDKCWFYGYEVDGKLVSTSMFDLAGDIGSLHEVSTLSDYRRKGIASAVVSRILSDAMQAGCTAVGLQASDAGLPVYEKLGFRTVNHICNYVAPPPANH